MNDAIRHFKVPVGDEEREACLGPNGSVSHVTRTLRMIAGRWKLAILFRLFAEPSMRSSKLLRDIPAITRKMLTQHLRELEQHGLVARQDFDQKPPRVEYRLTDAGRGLMPVLMSLREFSLRHPDKNEDEPHQNSRAPGAGAALTVTHGPSTPLKN